MACTDRDGLVAIAAVLGAHLAVSAGAGGAIVAISKVNAMPAAPGYAAARADLEGLVQQPAIGYAPTGVRVNAAVPSIIGDALASCGRGVPAASERAGGRWSEWRGAPQIRQVRSHHWSDLARRLRTVYRLADGTAVSEPPEPAATGCLLDHSLLRSRTERRRRDG